MENTLSKIENNSEGNSEGIGGVILSILGIIILIILLIFICIGIKKQINTNNEINERNNKISKLNEENEKIQKSQINEILDQNKKNIQEQLVAKEEDLEIEKNKEESDPSVIKQLEEDIDKLKDGITEIDKNKDDISNINKCIPQFIKHECQGCNTFSYDKVHIIREGEECEYEDSQEINKEYCPCTKADVCINKEFFCQGDKGILSFKTIPGYEDYNYLCTDEEVLCDQLSPNQEQECLQKEKTGFCSGHFNEWETQDTSSDLKEDANSPCNDSNQDTCEPIDIPTQSEKCRSKESRENFNTKPFRKNKALRMCTELRAEEKKEINRNVYRLAFSRKKKWRAGQTIKISFYRKGMEYISPTFTGLNDSGRTYTNPKTGKQLVLDRQLEIEVENRSPDEAIKYVVEKKIAPYVNLNFVWVKQDEVKCKRYGDIRIGFLNNGAYSSIGTDSIKKCSPEISMNFGFLNSATIIHEFLHALGAIHEHQNPKGEQIKWNLPVLYDNMCKTQCWNKCKTYHNVVQKYKVESINGSNYDPKSIMLYFYPAEVTLDGKGTAQNNILSPTDIEWMQREYPKVERLNSMISGINPLLLPDYNSILGSEKEVGKDKAKKGKFNLKIYIIAAIISIISILIFFAILTTSHRRSSLRSTD